ncbi:MAG: hypothetical protein KF784_11175 [Fimbriimonadaceae bacterium]|nr:hypothetical protein [Fimbriimonadaceae bacterium]
MPYIKPEQRQALDPHIDRLADEICGLCQSPEDSAGLVNYSCTRLVLRIIKNRFGGLRYSTLALFSGVFSNISSEFYRRVGVPYEEAKAAENGDLDWEV